MYRVLGTQILFYYETVNIIDRLRMYSGYPVRSMAITEKQPIDKQELVITNDDTTLILSECDRAVTKIFNVAYKLSKPVADSLLKNRTISLGTDIGTELPPVDTPTTTITVYGFRLTNKSGYNVNVLPMLDTQIEELLVSQVMNTWFLITRQLDYVKYYEQKLLDLFTTYNNSLSELYKPLIEYWDVIPTYTQEVITVDPDTNEITNTESGETGNEITMPTSVNEVLYFATFADFPVTGSENIIYVDRQTNIMYSYALGVYTPYIAPSGTYQYNFYDTDMVVAQHNLGTVTPTVQMIDADGNDWEIDTEIVDINTTICQWVGLKTGTLYFTS